MKKFTVILLICLLHISASAEQHRISKNTLLASSESLASEMGKTFQLAKNCEQNMENISAASASTLFRNYFDKHDVIKIMKQYELYVANEKGKLCKRDKVEFYVLMDKMAAYIRVAGSYVNK